MSYEDISKSGFVIIATVRDADAVALELAISNHVMAPKLPKPDTVTLSNLRQLFAFPTCISSLSPHSSHFPHLLPLLSANLTQATYSQNTLPTTHQAFSAEDLQIAHIRLANDKPGDDITPCCTYSALPLLTVLRSGLIRKDLE